MRHVCVRQVRRLVGPAESESHPARRGDTLNRDRQLAPGHRPRPARADDSHTLAGGSSCGERQGWVVEVDIRSFFDTVDHGHLRRILSRRVRDGVLLRLIGKWLNAGVLESGEVSYPETGTPQGGVISPLLANIYLHEVVDMCFEEMVKSRLFGRAFLIRYADDLAMVFSNERDTQRVMAVLPKRFGKYGLTLHPEKTRDPRQLDLPPALPHPKCYPGRIVASRSLLPERSSRPQARRARGGPCRRPWRGSSIGQIPQGRSR
jgi:hypothetical protein